MDGLKLVKRIRTDATHKDVPIIVITTEGSKEDRQRALQLGANAYITKPIQAPQVIAKVKELLKIDDVTRIKICGVTTVARRPLLRRRRRRRDRRELRPVEPPPRRHRDGTGDRAGGRSGRPRRGRRRRDVSRRHAVAARGHGGRMPAAARGTRARATSKRSCPTRTTRCAVATAEDAARAEAMPGEYVMVDAKVPGALGGTGRSFDWSLVVGLAKRRRLVLAGGSRRQRGARDRAGRARGASTWRAAWRARRGRRTRGRCGRSWRRCGAGGVRLAVARPVVAALQGASRVMCQLSPRRT